MKNVRNYLKIVTLLLFAILPLKWDLAMDNKPSNNTYVILNHKLDTLEGIDVKARTAEITPFEGFSALKLDGMLLFPNYYCEDACIEVEVMAENACYPGIVFRYTNDTNYELAYAVPHASNQPDAIQYDPVFNMSNTWQIYNGEPFQKKTTLPKNKWFTLRINISGNRAAIWVDNQPPLVVETLAHQSVKGEIGLWTYKPAYFRNLTISTPADISTLKGVNAVTPPNTITQWKTEDNTLLTSEPNGVLNLNRYMQPSKEAKKISSEFHLASPTSIDIGIGFSDVITLYIDGKKIVEDTHLFKGFADIPSRGWVTPGYKNINVPLEAGNHKLTAELKETEPFGWGLIVSLAGKGIQLNK